MNNLNELIGTPVKLLTIEQLESVVTHLNEYYRKGEPLVSDVVYDRLYIPELTKRMPTSSFLAMPEPTSPTLSAKGMMKHSKPMLSTLKANSIDEVIAYVERCIKAAKAINLDPDAIQYRITEKLDGVAGRLRTKGNGQGLFTRGSGKEGNIISKLIDKGLTVTGIIDEHADDSFGEIIIKKDYFEKNLSNDYSNPRNFVSGVVNADTHKNKALEALSNGAIELVIYNSLKGVSCNGETLINDIVEIGIEMRDSNAYLTDGVVIEVINSELRTAMGSCNTHHNYQLAYKLPDLQVPVVVKDIVFQVSKSGKLNPVIKIDPVNLCNVSITSITGHHLSHLLDMNVSIGATILISRANSVIPNLCGLVTPSQPLEFPATCPSCGGKTAHEGLYLVCKNTESCPAQFVHKIIHHMRLVGADLFGEKTVEKITNAGHMTFVDIYSMNHQDYVNAGVSDKQASNLLAEIERVKSHPLEDFKLLASFGISKLGRGTSEKLLTSYHINQVHDLSPEQINEIDGFGELTSESISHNLNLRTEDLHFLLDFYSSNLTHSSETSSVDGNLSSHCIVFSGKMRLGSRSDMKNDAESKGAKVQSSISIKTTTMLVCGENVGRTKLDKAKNAGIKIISEDEYYAL